MKKLLAVATVACVLGTSAMANAAELKVIAGGSMTASLNKLSPEFEKATGHRLSIHFDSTPNIIARVNSGTPFDVVVVPVDVFKDAAAKARFAPGPTVDIARVGYGVIVRAGAPKPDISTPDAFKKAMLAATSVAFLPASAAGAHITKVFERLGIAEEMKARTKVQASPAQIPQAVAKDDAELGVFLTNVLIAPGVELVGPSRATCSRNCSSHQLSPPTPKKLKPPRHLSTICARPRPPP